jgi:hypothetical protein
MAQEVECQCSKHEALSSNPSIAKKKKNLKGLGVKPELTVTDLHLHRQP